MSGKALTKRDVAWPENYGAMRAAIERCERVDECKSISDKAAALAYYAKQAEDTEAYDNFMRIRGRAIRRCGELLKEIERPDQGGRPKKNGDGTGPVSRTQAAREAGLSERQQKTALRVAAIPQKEFDKAIEAANPPSITELAARGTRHQKPLVDLGGRDPEEFKSSTAALGALRYFLEMCDEHSPEAVVRGAFGNEKTKLRTGAKAAIAWLQKLLSKLEG